MAAKFEIFQTSPRDIRSHLKARHVSSWRPITWFIVAVHVFFLAWLAWNVVSGFDACPTDQYSDACRAGDAIGTKIGMGIFIFLCVDVLLVGLWVATNKSEQTCPACGRQVHEGLSVCPGCRSDFAAAARGQDLLRRLHQ